MTATLNLSDGIRILDGADSVRDRVQRHLRFFFGEDFFKPTEGVPYDDDVFDRRGFDQLLSIVRRETLKVRDVDDAQVSIIDVDRNRRTARIQVVVASRFGSVSLQQEV